jgi:hypothetical protein
MTEAQFNATSIARKDNVLKNPTKYIVCSSQSQIPLISITQAQYDNLPPEKQTWIKNSGQYQIVP